MDQGQDQDHKSWSVVNAVNCSEAHTWDVFDNLAHIGRVSIGRRHRNESYPILDKRDRKKSSMGGQNKQLTRGRLQNKQTKGFEEQNKNKRPTSFAYNVNRRERNVKQWPRPTKKNEALVGSLAGLMFSVIVVVVFATTRLNPLGVRACRWQPQLNEPGGLQKG